MNKKTLKAFTLAEVLITLTIIGVIAALTIPNLMQSYKKHQVEVGVKEAYSILSHTIKMAEIETGIDRTQMIINTGSWTNNNFFLNNYFLPYIKYSEACRAFTSASACKIAPAGSTYNSMSLTYNLVKILLPNGMFVTFGADSGTVRFSVDIDGLSKGKNKDGYDTFYFNIHKNAPDKILTGYNSSSICSTTDLRGCSTTLQRNGWKIPDDYPVKKW